MSLVDNVVLFMGSLEAQKQNDGTDTFPALERLNAWLASEKKGKLHLVDQYGTNQKGMECFVAIGAFNFLDVEGFMKAFREADWLDPDTIQLMFKSQEDDVFREHRVTSDA